MLHESEPCAKPFLSLQDQSAFLKSRGLKVADDDSALTCLHRNGYYRLSAYWYPFRKIVDRSKTDEFLEHSHFEDARRLYVFDKQLKLHLLDAIERVEIAVRVEIAMCLGNRDTFAHLKPEFFLSKFTASNDKNEDCASNHEIWINKYQCAVTNSKDAFVKHHHKKFPMLRAIMREYSAKGFPMKAIRFSFFQTLAK